MMAGVSPIVEDKPSWASSADICSRVNSCDSCSEENGVAYCYYKDNGEASCCTRPAKRIVAMSS